MSRDQGLKKEMQIFPLVMVFGLPTVTTRNPEAFLLSYGHMCKNILNIINGVVELLWWVFISQHLPPGGGEVAIITHPNGFVAWFTLLWHL